jgi:argininosuccinate lyase
MSQAQKLWGGRFKGEADKGFVEFNRSFGFDRRLFAADIRASRAHCQALERAGIITRAEANQIEVGLDTIAKRAAIDKTYFESVEAEDVHSFVETKLAQLVGDAGRKLHTGRSRNDQVATDLRLWLRDEIDQLDEDLKNTQTALVELAERHSEAVLPGYTHLQRAQPILFAHWCLAYFEMLRRDRERFVEIRRRVNVLPLGAAALAGTSYPLDRDFVARALDFDDAARNSLDAVSDRDFAVETAAAASLVMAHLSRLAEDVILYATLEFGFFELSDTIATGSSIMPQKKNPDAMELVRGKAGRVFGHTISLLSMIKGLPLAYNKDMQEDKEALFDTMDTVRASVAVTATVLRNLSVREERTLEAAKRGYMNATELADYLARKGVPFREAHETVGRIVLLALEEGIEIQELRLDELRQFSTLIELDVYESLSLNSTLTAKAQPGGTAPERVAEALLEAAAYLAPPPGDGN